MVEFSLEGELAEPDQLLKELSAAKGAADLAAKKLRDRELELAAKQAETDEESRFVAATAHQRSVLLRVLRDQPQLSNAQRAHVTSPPSVACVEEPLADVRTCGSTRRGHRGADKAP